MPISQINVNSVAANSLDSSNMDSTSQYYGFKNRIINGVMMIDQRNAGASFTATNNSYMVDRYVYYATQASKFTAGQNLNSVTSPAGYSNYLGFQVSSSYSVSSTDYFICEQPIEGYNVFDLAWGTANAKTVTLSFQVYSSLTGTFGGSLQNSAQNRSYPFTYTISSANTWTSINITITGDTTGTWVTNNGVGIRVNFSLGSGSSVSGTSGAWSGSNFWSATGAQSVVGTSGATFYITGVQLEKGSTATSFDYRPYGTELALCQRYFYTCCLFNYGTNGYYQGYYGGSNANWNIRYPVQMRTTPTATISQPTQVQYYSQGGVWTNTTIQLASYNAGPNYNAGMTDLTVYVASDSTGGGKLIYLTGGATTTLPTIAISAEL